MTDIITRKELVKATGAPFYIISYLRDLGRLPIVKESSGRGNPNLYDPAAVDVVRDYLLSHTNG